MGRGGSWRSVFLSPPEMEVKRMHFPAVLRCLYCYMTFVCHQGKQLPCTPAMRISSSSTKNHAEACVVCKDLFASLWLTCLLLVDHSWVILHSETIEARYAMAHGYEGGARYEQQSCCGRAVRSPIKLVSCSYLLPYSSPLFRDTSELFSTSGYCLGNVGSCLDGCVFLDVPSGTSKHFSTSDFSEASNRIPCRSMLED